MSGIPFIGRQEELKRMNHLQQLASGIQQLNLDIPTPLQEQLLRYLELLKQWNQAYNLTAIRDIPSMITHHLLDSLTLQPYLTGNDALDVGTGAGLPGLPLAIVNPRMVVTLLDSNGKKCRFLQHVITELRLQNVNVVQERARTYTRPPGFDVILCRAVGEMAELIVETQHLLKQGGHWLFMKGVYPEQELKSVSQNFHVHSLTVSGLSAERHLVVVENKLE